jgi:hypothetical protein
MKKGNIIINKTNGIHAQWRGPENNLFNKTSIYIEIVETIFSCRAESGYQG